MPQVESYASGGRSRHERTLGLDIASLLSGAWRETSASSDFAFNLSADQLAAITPLLCHSGAAALAWYKIRNTPLATTAAGQELHEVYRRFRLSALIHEREIADVWSLLGAEGIEAVLVKGWAIARRYPDPALRPYGDIDLCIRPDQFEQAVAVLQCLEEIDGHHVDLHCGFTRIGQTKPEADEQQVRRLRGLHRFGVNKHKPSSQVSPALDRFGLLTVLRNLCNLRTTPDASNRSGDDWDKLFERSQVVMLNDQPVRILSDEDHLRLLCVHLLRSGARRPPWLCDVALLVEQVQSPTSNVQSPGGSPTVRKGSSDPGDFNWDICLGRDPVHANWVACAVRLAHELLGADIENTPFARRNKVQSPESKVQSQKQLPRWLAPALLQQWGRGRGSSPTVREGSARVQSQTSNSESHVTAHRDWTLDLGPWTSLYQRWDNPIRATAALGGQLNSWPRLPYRVAESIMRLRELPGHF